MSTPLTGYPDYQQYPAWRGNVLTSGFVTLGPSVTQTFGPYAMANFASVRISIQGNTNGCRVRLFGQNDAAGTGQTFIQWWDIRPATTVIVVVPVIYSYILIDVVSTASATNKIFLSAQPMNTSAHKTFYTGGNGSADAVGVTINNGQTLRFDPFNLVPGLAHLWIWGTVNPLPLDFNMMLYDYQDIEFQEISTWHAPIAVDFHALLVIPESSWRMRVVNNSGAAQTFWFTLVPVISGGG